MENQVNQEELSYAAAIAHSDPSEVVAVEEKIVAIDGIDAFVNLRSLNLSGNPHVKDFTFLAKLPKLEKLYLADLNLSEIPAEVGKLEQLTTLFLGKNPISDFSVLRKLPNLVDLGLSDCGLKKFPDEVLAVKGLEVLGLYGNSISTLAPLKALPNLKKLYIANNKLKKIPRELLKLKHLSHLDLLGNYTLEDTDVLWELEGLELLTLSNARGDNAVGPGVFRLTNLRELTLDIYWDESADVLKGLEGIGQLTKLEKLTISGANVRVIPEEFTQLKALKELTLKDQGLADISCLHDLPALETVVLASCSIKTIPEGFSTLKGLKYLNLSHNAPLESVPGLRDLPALEQLELFSKLKAVPETLGTLHGLRVLKLNAEKCPISFLPFLENLEELYIANVLFDELPPTLTKLKDLTLFRGAEATDDSYLARLPALEKLAVSQPNFKLPVIPNLRSLSVGAITGEADLGALSSMPHLQELRLHRSDVFVELPANISQAKGLQKITLEFLKKLENIQNLRDLPCLHEFEAAVLNLNKLPPSFATLRSLEHVRLRDMKALSDVGVLGELPHLRTLKMSSLDGVDAFPESFVELKNLEHVTLYSMRKLKDVKVLVGLPSLRVFDAQYCASLKRNAIADVENAIASAGPKDASEGLKMSYSHFMESGEYGKLKGKEDRKRTYGFPLLFGPPDELLGTIEDFTWIDDIQDDEESEGAAILRGESDVVPLAVLDWAWEGCDTSHIDAYSEEIFLVDTANTKNPVLIWGHDGSPALIHDTFDDFLASLGDFSAGGDEGGEEETYLEFVEGTSSKFWRIVVDGNEHTVTFGKIGTAGQSKTKTFADAASAQEDADKLIKSKRKKGYES